MQHRRILLASWCAITYYIYLPVTTTMTREITAVNDIAQKRCRACLHHNTVTVVDTYTYTIYRT